MEVWKSLIHSWSCMHKTAKWYIIPIKWEEVVNKWSTLFNATSYPHTYANRGIQTHYRRQKPLVTSVQIPQGNGEASGSYART